MKIAITGGTGFVGAHLARALLLQGHEVVLLSRHAKNDETDPRVTRIASDLSDPEVLTAAFAGCDAVAHCAGINRELGAQTYQRVHIEGTRNVVKAAQKAGVRRIALMSFLRARPNCGSPYHESKWAAEEIIRNSDLDYTIVKAGMVYGRGDHMLDHLSHAFYTLPLLATVGFRQKAIRPLAIEDLVRVLAQVCELTMKVPLVAKAQVQILAEGVVGPATACDPLPAELAPVRRFTLDQIRSGLPEPGPFAVSDLRCSAP